MSNLSIKNFLSSTYFFLQTEKEINQRSFSTSHPLKINTNFSAPVNLTKLGHDSSLSKDEPSPHFSPVFSPFPTIRTETIITPNITQKSNETNDEKIKSVTSSTASATGGIEFRLNKSSIDLTNITSSQTDRKSIIIPDLDPNEQKESKFRFPDLNIASIRRRSSSANHLRKPLRID